MNFIKTEQTQQIIDLRSQFYKTLVSPVDAMWELLYIASSQHYFIQEDDDKVIGYCCIDENNALLQIFLLERYKSKMQAAIAELIDSQLINSASLSSNEPISFNACLYLSKGNKPNTFCFEHTNTRHEFNSKLDINLATVQDIDCIKQFLKEQIGMDDTFGYTENLVSRKEIFLVRASDKIIATSERRMSDTQAEIADLGVIVHKAHQGKGIATQILQIQANNVLKEGRRPICSTTVENIASRKAIEKAGFYRSSIIFDIQLR